ncbi:MAG: hypothetical protein K8W52_18420 [Deltaproteobacteria bacterium]|nr:hypothetical protein [Deltaproteobacteria bacterium]
MKVAGILFIAACGASAHPPLAGNRPAVPALPGFADADLVTLGDGVVTTYALRGDAVVRLGEVRLAPPIVWPEEFDPGFVAYPLIGDWADRDHLFVRTGERRVVMVTADGITDVALPSPASLALPQPEGTFATGASGGRDYMRIDLVVTAGEAWWSTCPWSFPNDGGFCDKWVNTRLWPAPAREVSESEKRPRAWPWPDRAPRGFAIEPADGSAMTCRSPAGAIELRGKPESAEGADDGDMLFETRWMATDPPRLLVVFGHAYEYSPSQLTRFQLLDGCGPTAVLEGASADPGPGALWVADGVVMRGASAVGNAGDVRFRPSR